MEAVARDAQCRVPDAHGRGEHENVAVRADWKSEQRGERRVAQADGSVNNTAGSVRGRLTLALPA